MADQPFGKDRTGLQIRFVVKDQPLHTSLLPTLSRM